MQFVVHNIRWIMFASGALTFTMAVGLFSPQLVHESTFGQVFIGILLMQILHLRA